MTGAELLAYVRADVLRDNAVPYLWSDALIYRYLSAAQEYHARKTYSIVDASKTVTTASGTAVYALPAGTLHVLSARISTQTHDLPTYTRKVIPDHLLTSTGTPQLYTLDEATGQIRFYPVPDAILTVNLRIARLPAAAVSSGVTPEIPVQYHLDLGTYVAWKCLKGNDVDGSGVGSADRHEGDWNKAVSDAKREIYRLQLGANPTVVRNWTGKRN